MKKFMYGSLAIIFAISAFAFTNPEFIEKKRTTYDFYFQAPSGPDFSQSAVTTLSNWTRSTISCQNGSDKACKIIVEASYTVNEEGQVLNTTSEDILSLNTAGTETVKYIIETTGVATIENRN